MRSRVLLGSLSLLLAAAIGYAALNLGLKWSYTLFVWSVAFLFAAISYAAFFKPQNLGNAGSALCAAIPQKNLDFVRNKGLRWGVYVYLATALSFAVLCFWLGPASWKLGLFLCAPSIALGVMLQLGALMLNRVTEK